MLAEAATDGLELATDQTMFAVDVSRLAKLSLLLRTMSTTSDEPKIRILLAQEDPLCRRSLEEDIPRWGFELKSTSDGDVVIRHFAEQRYDLLLIDIDLPIIGGLELTKEIRAYEDENGFKPHPIVALSRDVNAELLAECEEARVTEVLSKPYSPHELRRCICFLLGRPHK
ncbi:response regulator [bacterium]|nr:response regulator [bacterium]